MTIIKSREKARKGVTMKKWPGVGARITERLTQLGYTSERAKVGVDIMRFCMDHRFPPGFVYKWLADVSTPDRDNLFRLAEVLEVEPAWRGRPMIRLALGIMFVALFGLSAPTQASAACWRPFDADVSPGVWNRLPGVIQDMRCQELGAARARASRDEMDRTMDKLMEKQREEGAKAAEAKRLFDLKAAAAQRQADADRSARLDAARTAGDRRREADCATYGTCPSTAQDVRDQLKQK